MQSFILSNLRQWKAEQFLQKTEFYGKFVLSCTASIMTSNPLRRKSQHVFLLVLQLYEKLHLEPQDIFFSGYVFYWVFLSYCGFLNPVCFYNKQDVGSDVRKPLLDLLQWLLTPERFLSFFLGWSLDWTFWSREISRIWCLLLCLKVHC